MKASDVRSDSLPSPGHVALALAVVRSKPLATSTEDYVASLRNAVDQTLSPEGVVSGYYFARSTYWQNAHQKSEDQKAGLLNEISQLQQAIRDQAKAAPIERAQGVSQRHTSPAITATESQNAEHAIEHIVFDLDALVKQNQASDRADQACRTILRGAYSLRSELVQPQPDEDRIFTAIELISHGICQSISSARPITSVEQGTSRQPSVESICRILSWMYPSMLQGLSIMPCEAEGGYRGVSELMKVFTSLLVRLHNTAVNEPTSNESGRMSKPCRVIRYQPREPSSYVTLLCNEITSTLATLITMLDPAKLSHCELLEGLLCIFLDHIGSALSLAVFTDPDPRKQNRSTIPVSKDPPNAARVDQAQANTTSMNEAPYLIYLLHRALDFVRQNAKLMSSVSLALFTLDSSTPRTSLHQAILRTLQNTLLQGVFGADDETFHNGLRREEDIEDRELSRFLEETDIPPDRPEWFVGQLWEHLGWDLLCGTSRREF